jgi:hypothetical protein
MAPFYLYFVYFCISLLAWEVAMATRKSNLVLFARAEMSQGGVLPLGFAFFSESDEGLDNEK